ncbi:MAG: serine/threonine protein kinase [Lentisphaeraceae bacterium]|nr:serine/threonine protein kinase [Lentisphaeraceae bacterium]
MTGKDKYQHLENSLNHDLLQFYDSAMEESSETISDDLAAIDKRYSNFELFAEGGTKRVYKALDNVVKRHIAYARLQEGKENQRENFLREARLTSLLQHPGIISVLDMGLEEEHPFFTMELKVGHSLGFILKKIAKEESDYIKRFPLNKLLDIFLKICEAVAYAHSQEIIHLDLKPDNIQVGEFGEVIICDWGLGKLISAKEETVSDNYENLLRTQTMTGAIKGTPGFMAPEQIKNGSQKKDQLTDLFSLGSILYNILTHKPPYSGDIENIFKQTLIGDLPDPILINPIVPESLNAVCLKAMECKREQRYQSADELKGEIENYLSGFATKAEKASFLKLFTLFYRRHKTLMATLISAIVIYFISSLVFIKKINNEKNEAIKQTQIAIKAQNAAEESFKSEKVARQEAEKALTMYEQQLSVSEDYRNNITGHANNFLRKGMFHPDSNKKSFTNIARNLRLLAEREPNDPEIFKLKGYLAFTMHRFKDAEKELSQSEKYGLLVKILKEFHTQVEAKNEYTTDEVIQLMQLIHKKRGDKSYSYIKHLLRFEALKLRPDYHKVIKAVLQIFNGESVIFDYQKENSFLRLGSPSKILTLQYENYNFLRTFKIRQLELNGTITKEKVLTQIRVLILDISKAQMKDYSFLKSTFSVKKLIVRKEQLPLELAQYLKKYVEIIER